MSAAIPTLAIFIVTSAAPPDTATPTSTTGTIAPTGAATTGTTAPTSAAPVADPATSPAPRWRRREQLAGAMILPLGLVALGALIPTLLGYRRTLHRADDVHTSLTCTEADRAILGRLLTTTRREEAAIVTLGVAAGVLLTTGVVLLVRGRRPPPRVQLGLDLRDHFGGLALSGRF